ncbi:hypothetical protein GF337_14180 [candidate division KSB1 bacterium]|nr:hypothetical protein [candidate division KSB1 bacterium]
MLYNKYISRIAILLIATMSIFILSCEESAVEPDPTEKPELPPATSMKMDLSLFTGATGQSLAKESAVTKNHFATAVVTVTLVNASVLAHLAIPTVVFAAAFSQGAEFQEDAKWHWIYSINNYSADLAGWIDTPNQQAVWEMYVSQGNNSDNFMWFTGRSNLSATSGYWLFYNPAQPDTSIEMVRVDWENNSETDRSLQFANVWEGNQGEGDILKYTVDGVDNSIEFYDASEDFTSIVYWNSETTAGYIHLPNYNNGEPAYWDENQNDLP